MGVFRPIARVRFPKLKKKVEYVDNGRKYRDFGVLRDGEEWDGDVREEYGRFRFDAKTANSFLKEGLLWEPCSRPFQPWRSFKDEDGRDQAESYYSVFQCYALHRLVESTTIPLVPELSLLPNQEDANSQIASILECARQMISSHKKGPAIRTAAICQIISNRYFPITQSDRRTIQLTQRPEYHDWDWYRYSREWDAKAVLAHIGMTADELKRIQEQIAAEARYVDPLAQWYALITFVSVEKKRKLKGNALLAQTLYSMEHMLRLFYREVTGETLPEPDESRNWTKDKLYGDGVTENELEFLEFLTNSYHLNPRPRLILIVEGHGEDEQFPRLAQELLGYSFARVGIEVENIRGVGNFTGRKGKDTGGAFERYIDHHHSKGTIVFAVLDKEGRVPEVKKKLVRSRSKYFGKRAVTKDEYVHVWDKSIEFDNFSYDEIAQAMTNLTEGQHIFEPSEIEDCDKRPGGDPLSHLFYKKVGHKVSKRQLLEALFSLIIERPRVESDENGEATRPIVQVIQKVIELAAQNYPPVCRDIRIRNQESGYFGDPKP